MKFLVILFILSGLFGNPHTVYAASKPTYNENITNTTGLLRAPEEVKVPQVASFVTWGFVKNFLQGLSFIPVIKDALDGSTSFSSKATLRVLNNKLEAERNMEATLKLTNKSIQDKYMKLIPDEEEFKDSANHVNCFTDEDGGSDHRPSTGQVSQSKSPGAAALTEGAMALHSTMSRGSLPMERYNWFSLLGNQLVGLENGLTCGRDDEGDPVGVFDNGDGHIMEYNDDPLQWTAKNYFSESEIAKVLACIRAPKVINPRTGKEEDRDCGDLTKSFPGITEFSTLVPHAEDIFKWLGRGPKDENEGAYYTSKPKVINNPVIGHGQFSQDVDLVLSVFTGRKTVEQAKYAWEAARRWDRDMFDCSLTPKQLQDPDKPCPTPTAGVPKIGPPNETITSSTAGDIPPAACSADSGGKTVSATSELVRQTATKYNIPSCALDGVAENEGAYIPSACAPNQCGAMGPFQITVGYTYATTAEGVCKETSKCAQCTGIGGGACPDALKYYVPGTDPCDPRQAAEAAASMLIGKSKYFGKTLTGITSLTSEDAKQAIIVAGDSYFGSTSVHYDGGCSYGEQVYKKCNPAYTCAPHAFPTKAPSQL